MENTARFSFVTIFLFFLESLICSRQLQFLLSIAANRNYRQLIKNSN